MKLWKIAALAVLAACEVARAAPVDDRNPVINNGAGVVVGAPTGGQLGPGTVNAMGGLYVNGSPVGGLTAVTTTPAQQTPAESGGTQVLGAQASNIITAGQCLHGCSIQDQTVNGFWVDETGNAAIQGAPSQYVPPGWSWTPDSGNTPYAVSVFPTQTGYISVRYW